MPLSIAIATYGREQVLLDTLGYLRALEPTPLEILVIDQTARHEKGTHAALQALELGGAIRWLRLEQPSITHAMNTGLTVAKGDVVLFVDDDVIPEGSLVRAHLEAHAAFPGCLVAGRVIQPWEEDGIWQEQGGSPFAGSEPREVKEFIGCNFSVCRRTALQIGGFDENFVRVAYRFEAEFARRYRATGQPIRFEPRATLHHLRAGSGGTRAYGDHLTTWRPDHAVGAYYFGLRTRSLGEIAARPLRAISTRYHMRHPWRIPATLFAELSGMAWALFLFARGPKLLASG